jgi:hypothetical protein
VSALLVATRDSDSSAEASVWVRAAVESSVDEVLREIGDEKATAEAGVEREEGRRWMRS